MNKFAEKYKSTLEARARTRALDKAKGNGDIPKMMHRDKK